MHVRLTTLGTPSVFLGDDELRSLPGKPVSFGLLVFLAVEKEATRDRLVSVFWPETTQEKARHALGQALYELRRDLGEGWVESSGGTIRTTSALSTDARDFEGLAGEGKWEEALALYKGHFLDGVHLTKTNPFQEWAERQRAHLSRRHRAAVDTHINELRVGGDLKGAVAAAGKWVRLDPLDDGGQHFFIQLLAETGNRTEALAQYERYQALLERELGLEPLDETVRLVEEIRGGSLRPPDPPPGSGESESRALAEREGSADLFERRDLRGDLENGLAPSLEVIRPIARGSMADLVLAREPHLKRLVAVKVLATHLSSDETARLRFEREAQAAARLNHPHVCTVHRVGSLPDGTPYLVQPFVKGASLKQRLKTEGRMSPEEVRQVVREVASALAAAHNLGIIHRDLRPDNVLREEDTGRHFLCDFGIAGVLETGDDIPERLTRTGEVLGNLAYISPEQVAGRPLTDRADIYSLGVMAHQLLTGHPPPMADPETRPEKGGLIPPDLGPLREFIGGSDPDLVEMVEKCLAIDPRHRPAAADISRKCEDRAEREILRTPPIPGPLGIFFSALLKRRFLQILGAYVAGGWLFLEAADQLEGRGLIPVPAYSLALNSALFGFLVANIMAWYHGERGPQAMTTTERTLLALVVFGWVVGCVLILF